MENLLRHISYLIDRHDCVVIPGIGAFLGHSQPARFDPKERILYPPSREISLNGAITFDDGLLVSSYARQQSINYTNALEAVRCETAIITDTLRSGGEIKIPYIGSLRVNDQGNYIFSPAENCLCSTCLPSVKVACNVSENISHAESTVILSSPSRFSRILNGAFKYAAMLILMVSIAVIFSTPIVDETDYEIVKANMCPFNVAESYDDGSIAPEFLIAQPIERPVMSGDTLMKEELDVLIDQPYVLIIASLASEALAEKFIAEVGDDAKGIISANGRYRVYGATGDSPASLLKSRLLDRYPDAWPMAVNRN